MAKLSTGNMKYDLVDTTVERSMAEHYAKSNDNWQRTDDKITDLNKSVVALSSNEIRSKEYQIPLGGTLYLDHSESQFVWLILGRGPSGSAKMIAFASGYAIGGTTRDYVEPLIVGSNEITVAADRPSVWIKNGAGSILNIKVLALYGALPVN